MHVQFLEPSHPLWVQILQQLPHDFYHLPSYLKLEARRIQATPEAILIQDDEDRIFFLPYLLRQWSSAMSEVMGWDVVSPYGYPGFIVNSSATDSSGFIQQAILQMQQAWQDRNVCSAFLRLHPILNDRVEHDLVDNLALHVDGRTVSVDLSLSLDDLWKQTRENHRRGVRHLKQAGFSVSIIPIEANLDIFITIYEQTMDRVGAKPLYYFSRDYFIQLIQALNSKIYLFIARLDHTVASAALITECNGIVQYHLGGTLNDFLKEAPMKLIFDYVRTWAKERGNRTFHLGGGLGAAQDSLYNFKAGFANQIHSFSTMRLIINEAQYLSWVALKAQQLNQTQEHLLNTNFFPAYRIAEDPIIHKVSE